MLQFKRKLDSYGRGNYCWICYNCPPLSTLQFSSVQFSQSVVSDSATPWIAARQASLCITNSRSSLRVASIPSVTSSSHFILGRPLFLLPPIPPSIKVFSNESALRMRWPKYWSFSFSIIPSKEIHRLISFRMDWLDLLAVQGTLKSLLQNSCLKDVYLDWSCCAFYVIKPPKAVRHECFRVIWNSHGVWRIGTNVRCKADRC